MTGSSEVTVSSEGDEVTVPTLSSQGERILQAWRNSTAKAIRPELPWQAELSRQISGNWPSAREEQWKYSPIAQLQTHLWSPQADELRFELPEGVEACRMSAVSGSTMDRAKQLLSLRPAHRFNAMSWIVDQDVWVIRVPRGVKPKAPLRVFAPAGIDATWSCSGWILIVESEAQINVVESYGPQASASSWGARFFLEPSSVVEHVRIQNGGMETWSFAESIVLVGENARYVQVQISSGGRMAREDAEVRLQGRGAEANLDAVFMARQDQVLDHRTTLDHEVGETRSHQLYKGLLADQSKGIFNGRILIRRNAIGSNASQLSQNLLLSDKAEIDTKPELQIDADDVKAAHGAAVGQLDAEHLFYLRSRGISEAAAREVLLLGFALDALRGIQDPELRQVASAHIEGQAHLMLAAQSTQHSAGHSQ